MSSNKRKTRVVSHVVIKIKNVRLCSSAAAREQLAHSTELVVEPKGYHALLAFQLEKTNLNHVKNLKCYNVKNRKHYELFLKKRISLFALK